MCRHRRKDGQRNRRAAERDDRGTRPLTGPRRRGLDAESINEDNVEHTREEGDKVNIGIAMHMESKNKFEDCDRENIEPTQPIFDRRVRYGGETSRGGRGNVAERVH